MKLETAAYGQGCIKGYFPREEAQAIRSVVCNNYSNHKDYQIKFTVHPFVQCFSEEGDKTYVLVEFWAGTKEEQETYVRYVEKRVPEVVKLRKELGL